MADRQTLGEITQREANRRTLPNKPPASGKENNPSGIDSIITTPARFVGPDRGRTQRRGRGRSQRRGRGRTQRRGRGRGRSQRRGRN